MVRRTCHQTLCCNEIFLQSYAYNHKNFLKNVYCINSELKSYMRHIDRSRRCPYTFFPNNMNKLCTSNALFSRKINSECMNKLIMQRKCLMLCNYSDIRSFITALAFLYQNKAYYQTQHIEYHHVYITE